MISVETAFVIGVVSGAFAIAPIAWYLAYDKGIADAERERESSPLIDFDALAKIPGLKIKGSGIDIDTSKMAETKK